MKTYLLDMTNWGIIYITEPFTQTPHWNVQIMKMCILDSEIGIINAGNPLYEKLNNTELAQNFYQRNRALNSGINNQIIRGTDNECNGYFLEKQRKAVLIGPLVALLTSSVKRRLLNRLATFDTQIEDTLAHEVLKSNPTTGTFTHGILEYADILNITPEQAYVELRLDYETIHSIKMRAYATIKKYQSLIREVNTKKQADDLYVEMEQKLLRETFI
jgi:hypothetical protein